VKKTSKTLDKKRRDFIKKSALAGAGVAAATVGAGEAMAAVEVDERQVKQNKGYQLTNHVLDYYKSAAS